MAQRIQDWMQKGRPQLDPQEELHCRKTTNDPNWQRRTPPPGTPPTPLRSAPRCMNLWENIPFRPKRRSRAQRKIRG
jgi:hypothetical protein